MVNNRAREIIEKAELRGLTHRKIAEICNVEVGTVSRWKLKGRARAWAILPLEEYLALGEKKKFLEEASVEEVIAQAQKMGVTGLLAKASLEELGKRAEELGYQVIFIKRNN